MKEPSIYDLKAKAGLPIDAKFIGWVIHEPNSDEYLVKYQSNDDYDYKGWGMNPEEAKIFKTLKKANAIIGVLQMENRAIAAPAFDLGKQIVVLTDVKDNIYKNPLRELTEQLNKADE